MAELKDLQFWRRKFNTELNQLNTKEVMKNVIPNMIKVFTSLYQSYKSNSAKSSGKLDKYSERTFITRFLLKYPFSIVLSMLISLAFLKFYGREQRTITRVMTKSFNI